MASAEPKPGRSDDDDESVESGTTGGTSAASLPTAVVVPPKGAPAARPDPTRWIRRGVFLGVLVIGWLFILYINRFTYSAPTVFVCLAYLAVCSTGYALWRTGVVVVADDGDEADSTWGRPLGRRSELEREKKTLLKAIKEAEFDREMGKLSKSDAEEMIAVYRVRAIEVIKEIDQMDVGKAGTVREQIERELKARLELETRADKAKADALADASKDKKKKEATKKGAKPAAKDSKEHVFSREPAAKEPASESAATDESKGDVAQPDAKSDEPSKEATS